MMTGWVTKSPFVSYSYTLHEQKRINTLILILGDQLQLSLSSLRDADKNLDVILMAEVMAEATYARHHKKKFVFGVFRHAPLCRKLRAGGLDS